MMAEPSLVLCVLAAIGLLAVGALAIIAPMRLARSYGVGVDTPEALVYVRATGARDFILGLILAAAAYRGELPPLIYLCALGVLLSLADFALAFAFARRFRSEHLAHLGGAAGFLVIIALLLHSMRP